ncbi:MAG: c-type cytochrome [Chloroflexota bacterium]
MLLIVVVLPLYAWQEPLRMEAAQSDLRQTFVSDAAVMYVENCAICHGAAGEGIGSMPALDNDGLREADYDLLYKTIARGRYDTAMAAWHSDEGGIYNDYQIEELIALIRYGDWSQVGELAAAQGLIPPTLPVPEVDEAFLAEVTALGDAGSEWAAGMQLFANNCTVCHGINGEGSDLGVPLHTADVQATDAAELVRIITEGVPGTMMAAWDKSLTPEEIASLVSFLQNWDTITAAGLELTPPEPIRIDLNNPEEVLALGQRIFDTTCAACHGENGSGGTGPVLNSQQILTSNTDDKLLTTIINGGRRPNSTMPAFGDRLTMVEMEAVVAYLRSWEPTAPLVENPRGTAQGGGPPWLQATPDAANPISPGQGQGGQGQGQGGPPWRDTTGTTSGQSSSTGQTDMQLTGTGETLSYAGVVSVIDSNMLTIRTADGQDVTVMLGPPWFWEADGIALTPGDQVELEGFESTDHVEVNWLTNLTTGAHINLRTPTGQPVWGSE